MLLVAFVYPASAADPPSVAAVEAAYLLNFLKYTEWPGADGEPPDDESPGDDGRDAAPAGGAPTGPAPGAESAPASGPGAGPEAATPTGAGPVAADQHATEVPVVPPAPLVISVVGNDAIAETYAAVAAAAGPINGRPVLVRDVDYTARARGTEDSRGNRSAAELLRSSHLVFIDRSAARTIPYVLRELKGRPVLTASNAREFVDDGGMLELLRSGRNIVFAANPDAIREAGILLSSRVLKLARNTTGTAP